MSKPRVRLPKTAKPGEVIAIKTLIKHRMESGQRKDPNTGETIPRKIINRFECTFEGEPVVSIDLDPAISANPFIEFEVQVPTSGTFAFTWHDDDGAVYATEKAITVEG